MCACAGVIQDQTQQQAGLAANPDTTSSSSSSSNATIEQAAEAAPIVAGLTGGKDLQQQQQQQQVAVEPLAVTTLTTSVPVDNIVGSTPAGEETEQFCWQLCWSNTL